MKFTKLAKSEKFEYMMLSRLIQDAKYFIEHPDLKHLWARTLDEHIKQMKEQYAKLDPKPEWISEEEINNLAKQMKESYTNHWNEVHPDNKIKATIQQPNKPKPTTMLPDNMQWAWDPDAADWVAVLKDNTNTTPPLYDPNNQNVTNQTTSYMSNIKSASVIDGDEDEDPLWVRLNDLFLSDGSLVDSYIKNEINCDDIIDALNIEIKNKIDYKKVCDYIEEFINDNYMSDIKSSCLAKFLDGPKYSKEIKIESGLIKNGLVKYAGFDFNRGTKYAITTKGLEVLRKASETEQNEALNEREKLAYMFGFNTDEVSTLDTTGKVIKQSAKKWTICEADGTELGEVEADSELDAKVKFGIEHPEYADSQSICAKEIKSAKQSRIYVYNINWNDERHKYTDDDNQLPLLPKSETLYESDFPRDFEWEHIEEVPDYIMQDAIDDILYKMHEVQPHSFEYEIKTGNKTIDAQYEQTTNTKEPYPNPSETPNDHIILENHDGWVNTASFEDDMRKQFQQPHQKLPNSDMDLELLEKQVLDLMDEDKKEQIKALFDKVQFSDKEAAQVTPEFAKLHELLGKYKGENLIQLADVDGNLVASGDPQVINNLEHEVKDIGYYCESVSEDTDSDYAETYSLKIFYK